MAQSYLDSLMSEREKVLYSAHQHWFILARNIALEIFLILLFLAITVTAAVFYTTYALIIVAVGFVLILLPIATMTRDILNYTHQQFIVTNRRVIRIAGVLNKNVTDSSLEKVNDVKMVQTAAGRMFDYGNIEILTASELGVNLFKQIEGPVRFKTAMLNAKQKLEDQPYLPPQAEPSQTIPGLIAQLDVLRQQGALSEAEFQEKKKQLLAKL
jgi:uncharacterized membrane protein YdbT with pleckstrin-like domain